MRVSGRRREINDKIKDKFKQAIKEFRKAVASNKIKEAQEAMKKSMSALDKAVKKHTIHKNKASRLKSRMATALAKLK